MSQRHLPVRPDLDQLKHQAKDLLRAVKRGDHAAVADLRAHHPTLENPASAKLADAQLALARSYGVPSWPRLVVACRLIDAIWKDDVEAIKEMVKRNPALVHEMARGTESCNWGPPMSYAANLGRDRIIDALRDAGAKDVQHAFARAVIHGEIDTARRLYDMAGRPAVPENAAMWAAECLCPSGLALLLELGATITDEKGDWRGPVAMALTTYSRNPHDKHALLEMMVQNGIQLPDTPTMAVHRGRIDLLESHRRRDPDLLQRTFSIGEIYPLELGCGPEDGIHGTPLAGATLLHMAIDYGEFAVVEWLIAQGTNVDVRAGTDADGFGGHTALFGAAVSYMHRVCGGHPEYDGVKFVRLLLDRGADPNVRVSLRKRDYDDHILKEYRDVTPVAWAERYHDPRVVSRVAVQLICERGGVP